MSLFVYLAHQIEWLHAKDRAALINRLRRGGRRTTAHMQFDPHAATELAELIARALSQSKDPSNG